MSTPDKKLSAACGLFCPACSLYIATQEDPQRLRHLAELFNLSEEEVMCNGCRSEKLGPYCKTCKMTACTAGKGISFCGECKEYPCPDLQVFQAAMPHRRELWEAQERIKKVGWEQWLNEMYRHYTCPECQTLNSAYDLKCRKCGNSPSCEYVGRHTEAIRQHIEKSR